MRKMIFATPVLALAALAPSAAWAAPFELKSEAVTLPYSNRMFPTGPGSDAMNTNCLICHSAGMVLTQPRLSRTVWGAEVNKMIKTYKAPVAPQDVNAILDYLTNLRSSK